MILRIISFIKGWFYKAKYGKCISLKGMQIYERSSRINLKKGILSVGSHFTLKQGAYLAVINGGKLTIGNSVSIARDSVVVCHDCITIGDHCAIAPHVLIYDHDHKFGYEGIQPGYHTAPVVIGDNCWIGAGVIILRGTHIGEGSVIGAGCIVQGEIPPHSLVKSDRELSISPLKSK